MDVDLYIEGITAPGVTEAITQGVRRVRRLVAQPGEWRVTVSPSETRGEWDLGVQVSSTRHFASFNVPVTQLPTAIESQVRKFVGVP